LCSGRGSIHFHGLIWLRYKPNPVEFEHLLLKDNAFKKRLVHYLDFILRKEEPALNQCNDAVMFAMR
jgi:hypothetical protein